MMIITISNKLKLTEAPETLLRKIRSVFTIENPAYLDNAKMGRWQGNTDQWLVFYESANGLIIPRGAMSLIVSYCRELGIQYQIDDRRCTLPMVDFKFEGILKDYQQEAATGILARDFNVLEAPTGSGKTIMAIYAIAARRQPTLIIVHTKELLNQWVERLETFLNIPRAEIGIIGNGKNKIGKKITVGIINSIYPIVDKIKNQIGHLIVDECHRCPSRTFTQAVTRFDCRYMLGLSATPFRRDGLTKLIGWHLGSQVAVKQSDLTEIDILNVEVVARETNFRTDRDASAEYTRVLSELTEDRGRNRLIVADIHKEASNGGGVCLVLSDRKSHCETIKAMLHDTGINADMLTGNTGNRDREAIVTRLAAGSVRVLIATGQLIGEGFDAKSLQTLFLATPIKFDGRLIQYPGRIMRPAPGKDHARVYDYIDANVGVLTAAAHSRQKVYERHA